MRSLGAGRLALAAALPAALLGCAAAAPSPGAERPPAARRAIAASVVPAADAPARDATAPAATPPARPLAAADGGLTLERALALALERNPDMAIALARIGEAEARIGEATSAFLPQVQGRVSYERTDNPLHAFGMIVAQRRFTPALDVNDPGATQSFRPEVTLGLSLFEGGRDWSRREAATLGAEAQRLSRDAVANALAGAVHGAFYGALAAGEMAEVARASIAAVEAERAAAQTRVQAGTGLRSDVLSLDVRLAVAREAEVRAKNGVEHALAGLRSLLGAAPGEALPPLVAPPQAATTGADASRDATATATATATAVASLPLQEALARALARRPEIAAARSAAEARRAEVSAEKAAHLPRVSGFASYGQDAPDLELSSTQDNWSVGVMVEVDIFSGFRTVERVRASEQRLLEAEAQARHAQAQVELELRTAHVALADARERARVTAAAIAAADEALRLVAAQYQAGAVPVTRFLEAEAARADARARAVAARWDARRAEAALRKAMGDLA